MGQAKRGMACATYYAANIGKQIKTDPIVFSKTHRHGAKPTAREVARLLVDLKAAVADEYRNRSEIGPDVATIERDGRIETYSAA